MIVFTATDCLATHFFVVLGNVEKSIIAACRLPVHVFWISSAQIKEPYRWPQDRVYLSSSGESAIGVFVVYHSDLQPVNVLGKFGDLWVTGTSIYYKESDGIWSKWTRIRKYVCPYESGRHLVLSRSADLKYLSTNKNESRLWRGASA